jgi:hypothetical protein
MSRSRRQGALQPQFFTFCYFFSRFLICATAQSCSSASHLVTGTKSPRLPCPKSCPKVLHLSSPLALPSLCANRRIFCADADDESLRRYKASLLGAAATAVPKSEDPRQVHAHHRLTFPAHQLACGDAAFARPLSYIVLKRIAVQVVPTEFRLQFEDRPGGDIVYALTDKGKVSDLKSRPFVLKEGCSYRLQVTFKTQHEIVTGLKFVNTVTCPVSC